jgi:hypothetical protein
MLALGSVELVAQERGILPANASAAYLDCFSRDDRLETAVFQEPVLTPRTRDYYSRGQAYTVRWQDYGQPLPVWFDPLMQGFTDLLTLPPDWNSYGAGAIDRKVIHDALNFINGMLGPTSPVPRVVPLSSGGLQLEWRKQGVDLEIVFDPGEQFSFYLRNRVNGEESEHALPESADLLRSIIRNLE